MDQLRSEAQLVECAPINLTASGAIMGKNGAACSAQKQMRASIEARVTALAGVHVRKQLATVNALQLDLLWDTRLISFDHCNLEVSPIRRSIFGWLQGLQLINKIVKGVLLALETCI
jgi:hypothetical protein